MPVKPVRKTVKKVAARQESTGVKEKASATKLREVAKVELKLKVKKVKRTTARKKVQTRIKVRASKAKVAATKRVRSIGRKKTLKVQKKKVARTAASKVSKAKSLLKARGQKAKTKKEFENEQKKVAIREQAVITRQVRNMRRQQRQRKVAGANKQKVTESKRNLAKEDTRQLSTEMSLVTKPTSRSKERKAAADTMKDTVDGKATQLNSAKQSGKEISSGVSNETANAGNTKTAASRNEPSIDANKRALESQDSARSSVIKTLQPVSQPKLQAYRTKADDAASAKTDTVNSGNGRQDAASNRDGAKNRADAANQGRGAEAANGKSYADSEGSAHNAGADAKAAKAAAAGKNAESVTGDIGAAKAKRDTTEKGTGDAQKGVTKATDDNGAATKARKDSEGKQAANDADVSNGERSRKEAGDDMSAGVTAHQKRQQDVDGVNQARAAAKDNRDALGQKARDQRAAADTLRPVKSPAHAAKQKDRDANQGKMDQAKADRDAAVTKFEMIITTRNGAVAHHSNHEVLVAKNKADSDNASSNISEGSRRQATEKDAHAAHATKESDFKSTSQKQTAAANKKAEVIESLNKTNEITHAAPPPTRAAPNRLKAEGDIRSAAGNGAVSSGVRSHSDSAKKNIADTRTKEGAAKDRLANESTTLDNNRKALSDEQAQAKRLKDDKDGIDNSINSGKDDATSIDTALKPQKDRANDLENELRPRLQKKQDNEDGGKHADQNARKAQEDADSAAKAKAKGEDDMNNSKAQKEAEAENGKALKQNEADAAKAKKDQEDKKDAAEKAGKEQAESDVNAAKAKKKQLEETLAKDTTKSQRDKASEDVDGAQKTHDENEADINAAKAKKNEEEARVRDAEDAHNANKKAEADLVKEHGELDTKIKSLEKQIKKAEADANSYYPQSSAKRKELRDKVDELNSKLDGAKKNKSDLEANIASKRGEKDQLDALTKERDGLHKEKSDLEGELSRNKKEIEDIDAQINANNKKTPPDKDLDAELKRKKKELEDRNKDIGDRLDKINNRIRDIDGEIDNRRAREKLDDAARRKKDEDEFLRKVRKDSDDFDAHAGKRTGRLNDMIGISSLIISIIQQFTGPLPDSEYTSPFDPANMDVEDQETLPDDTDLSGADASSGAKGKTNKKGNVQTCYAGICTIQNVFCSKGTSEYLRGCKDGTSAGTTDGKNDGAKDQKQHQDHILPLSTDEIAAAVSSDMAAFTEIEKQAYCQQVENEARNSGMDMKEFFSLYPECKVSPVYGAPPLPKAYGDKDAYGAPDSYGQEGGGPQATSSSDYLLGYTESYNKAYLQSYTNGWALSKINTNEVIPIVMKPSVLPEPLEKSPYGESKYGETKYGSLKGGKISSSQLKKLAGKTIQRLALKQKASEQ
jgi:mediator of RNA polymerase II transcription subunit 21